ncbi:zinc-ribbon domain-containing protein [Polycladidibacter hongkongensis]|uniref:zinc-ribbon domain-containing protein n=1 Tax=Polycladidibacter hongkongensis TaxID=1647556 RepID=UPI00082AD660|nr:zinc-ribbon domain-containing protein [Pseudovibrio hongkongensis]
MKITCSNCKTTYAISEEKLGSQGRKLKCSKCGTVWHEPAPQSLREITAPQEQEPASLNLEDGQIVSSKKEVEKQPAKQNEPTKNSFGEVLPAFEEPPQPANEQQTQQPAEQPKKPRPSQKKNSRLVKYPARAFGMALFALAVFMSVGTYTYRNTLVKRYPELASLYRLVGISVNTRGLVFNSIRTFREYEEGSTLLVVEGTIENISDAAVEVPPIRLSMRGQDNREITAWTAQPLQTRLTSGQKTRFRTRLAKPSEMATSIQLRFTKRLEKRAKN